MTISHIFVASDHGGYALKGEIIDYLRGEGYAVTDLGPETDASVDYPAYGQRVGQMVTVTPDSLGVVVCGSGVGISIAANKISGVRCALANSTELARLSREHNGANVLALGARTHFVDPWVKIVGTFVTTDVDRAERHERRRSQLDGLC